MQLAALSILPRVTLPELLAELRSREAELRDREAELSIAKEQNTVLREHNARLKSEHEDLKRRLDAYCHRLYGKRSEQVDPAQLALAFAELAKQDAAAATAKAAEAEAAPEADSGDPVPEVEQPAARPGHGRGKIPEHLERERIETRPPPEECFCSSCKVEKVEIGTEVSEQYEVVPSVLKVIQHVRVKMACPKCKEGVVIGPVAEKIVDKGLAGPGLLARTIVAKFQDHLPLYRQSQIYARMGAKLSDSTLLSFINQGAALLSPIAEAVFRTVLAGPFVHVDETPVTMKLKPQGTRTAYLYTCTDREQVGFRFAMGRSQQGPIDLLGDYAGYVHRDAYAGYLEAMRRGGATWIACWAHVRRGFHEALKTDTMGASKLLAMIQLLYRVEADARGLDDAARQQMRAERSVPLLTRIEAELKEQQHTALPQSALGKAVAYAQNQWPALIRYVEHGMLAIDNNEAERAIRPIAVGRKNWLVAGSEDGGHRAAILYTLVGSCRLLDINPLEYLRDVLARVSTHPASRVAELTPKAWKAARTVVR